MPSPTETPAAPNCAPFALTGRVSGLTPIGVCQSLPDPERPEVARDNIIDGLETQLGGGTRIVAVEGDDGAGKTTVLAQFARRHARSCIALFVSSASRYAYHPAQLTFDLCNQLEMLLQGRELDPGAEVSDTDLRARLNALHRQAQRKGETIYFVVDGIEEVPKSDSSSRRAILDLLPLTFARFRFLFSGALRDLDLHPKLAESAQPFRLPFFGLSDTVEYLADLGLDREQIEEVYRSCRGMPGYLAVVRSRLVRGDAPTVLVANLPDTLERLFELEWRDLTGDRLQRDALAIIAHERRRFSLTKLADVLGVTADAVRYAMTDLDFLPLSSHASDEVRFRSEAFRRFAAAKLVDQKVQVHTRLIDYLLKKPRDEESLTYLPEQFAAANRLSELLEYLSAEQFVSFLERSPSVKAVQETAELGITASRKLGRDADLVRFTLQRSTIAEIVDSEAGRSEVRALTLLGDYGPALALAQSAVRVEDRMLLLAAAARGLREQGLSIDEDLTAQIVALHAQVDYVALGAKRAEAIAVDLAHTHLDLAIEVIARATKSAGDHRLDWAFAKLAINASMPTSDRPQPSQSVRDLTERIADPLARRLSTEAMVLLGGATADEAIAEAARLTAVSDQLYVLRKWVIGNRERSDAERVIEHGVILAIQSSGYAINATAFRELGTGLPYMHDAVRARRLISMFDSQLATLQAAGPSEDVVRLMLLLARTEQRHYSAAVLDRVMDTYLFIQTIDDYATRTACTARLLAALSRLDPDRTFEERDQIHSLVDREFDEQLTRLLGESADHYEAAGGIVRALALQRPDLALRVARQLNTEIRRDEALADFVDAFGNGPIANLALVEIRGALRDIVDPRVRDDARAELLERLARRRLSDADATIVAPLFRSVTDLRDAAQRAEISAAALGFCARHASVEESIADHLRRVLEQAWTSIDAPWVRVDVGFAVVATLARDLPDDARVFAERIRAYKASTDLHDDGAAVAAVIGLRLAVRAFAGLLPRRGDRPEDMERLSNAVSAIPSAGARAELWADLAMRLYLAGRVPECQRLVNERIKPLLREFPEQDAYVRARVMVVVAPALYAAYPHSVAEVLRPLPAQERDEAYALIAYFLFRRTSTFDPYDDPGSVGYPLDYERAIQICQLLPQFEQDARLYDVLCDLVESVVSTRQETVFTRPQRQEIARQLADVVAAKFPNSRHITHNGYLIVARAHINRMVQRPLFAWDELLGAAREVPNGADKAYVLGVVAAAAFRHDTAQRSRLLNETCEIIETIPTLVDRIQHYQGLARLLVGVDNPASKAYLRTAMQTSRRGSGEDVAAARRSIVDLAHRVDPEFASALASELNDDPARQRVARHVSLLELKRTFATRQQPEEEKPRTDADYSRAAWMKLGTLNAGRTDAVPMERALAYADHAARQPVYAAYPIFAWLAENAVRRYGNTSEAARFVVPIFEASLLGAEMAVRVASRSGAQNLHLQAIAAAEASAKLFVARPGARDEAIAFIREWLTTHLGAYLKIADPYFTYADLEALRIVRQVHPDCRIIVLTSQKVHAERHINPPYEPQYEHAWAEMTDDPSPEAEVVLAAIRGTGDSPVHDRWWITDGAGIELGTSWNSLGVSKVSSVRVMDAEEVAVKEAHVDEYAVRKAANHNGARVAYTTVLLG